MTKVLVLNLRHGTSSIKNIVFDKVYFFPKTHADYIRHMFEYALRMEITPNLIKQIKREIPSTVSYHSHKRNDGNSKTKPQIAPPIDSYARGGWWDTSVLSDYNLVDDYYAVVPLLVSKAHGRCQPRYLAHPPTRNFRNAGITKQYSPLEGATVVTRLDPPHDEIVSICGICPNAMGYLQNECYVGSTKCNKYFNFNSLVTVRSRK